MCLAPTEQEVAEQAKESTKLPADLHPCLRCSVALILTKDLIKVRFRERAQDGLIGGHEGIVAMVIELQPAQ